MTKYLVGKAPSTEQLHEWTESFHRDGFLVIHNRRTLPKSEAKQSQGFGDCFTPLSRPSRRTTVQPDMILEDNSLDFN